jgi:hypothetical protein
MVTPYIPIPVRYPHPHLIRSYGFLEIVSVSSMAEQSKPVKLAVNDAWPGRHRHPKFWVRKMWGKTTENRWLSKKTWHVYTRGIMAQIVGMSAEKNNKKQTYFGMVQNDWTVMISFVSPYPTSEPSQIETCIETHGYPTKGLGNKLPNKGLGFTETQDLAVQMLQHSTDIKTNKRCGRRYVRW